MSTCRKFLGTAVLDDHLYAVGGQDKSNCHLNSAEVYNPSTNEWTAGADMNKQRSGLGLVVANGRLYALGGTDGSADHETVEVFDVQTNQWTNHSRMNEA
ncbi:kelch repeat protein [Cooperia oncophora]